MKLKVTENGLKNITKISLIICVIAIIVQLFPTENKFKYQFETGKPWSYELITALFDFPIYKSEAAISLEKGEKLKTFTPLYKIDVKTKSDQLSKLKAKITKNSSNNQQLDTYLLNKFNKIYDAGILSAEDYEDLTLLGIAEIKIILPNRVTQSKIISDIFTPKTAYNELIEYAPEVLKSYDLNLFLVENLKYDSITSEATKNELLKNISLTTGMVQMGERIIDRGEIVTTELFEILNSLKIEYERKNASIQQSAIVLIGEIIIITGLIVLFFLYLNLFRPRIYDNFGNLLFISLLILILVALVSLTIRHTSISYYVVPYAILPIIIRVFFDSRTALFAHIITILIISFMVDNASQFIIIQIMIGMVTVSSLKDMTQRSQLAQTALYAFLSYSAIYIASEFITEGDIQRIHFQTIVYFGISSSFLLLAYLLIYLFEKIFNLISAITLVELTNINSDLMMLFAEKAPGTFQHTLQVSNLATEAAKKIGANSLLVRTGALYHDIGKMKHPEYYTENQLGGENPLKKMDLEAAAKLIISHVTDGVEIAKKNHLPEQIINFITTHHGFSKTKYFYNSFINANPDVIPNDIAFTYPGPLPNSKETAILMMADAVEARSRSLTIYTEETINEAIEQMIDAQIADGQFKDAPISFRDVEAVKTVFKEKIKNIYHTRIVYPEIEKKKTISK